MKFLLPTYYLANHSSRVEMAAQLTNRETREKANIKRNSNQRGYKDGWMTTVKVETQQLKIINSLCISCFMILHLSIVAPVFSG